jgi:peptide subunit release factor 1 (eRF1)
MITREEINELAQFEDRNSCAITFYLQPRTPHNKAHKEETILTKDLARDALHELERKSREGKGSAKQNIESARSDLDRIVRFSHDFVGMRGNGTHTKAVFACSSQNFWREYDLPAQLGDTVLTVNRRFRLKPLAQLLGAFPPLGIVLIDRHRARLFDLRLGELTEREDFFHPLPHRGRGDGFAGYEAGHAERRVADEARQHFKNVTGILKNAIEKGLFEKCIIGCQETLWPSIEAQLHPYVLQRLLGRFSGELVHERPEQIRAQAGRIFEEWKKTRSDQLVAETISQARAHGRGVTGLRRVLQSLEAGEVQTLLLGENYHAQAVECSGCGHLDAHLVSYCPACGRVTRRVVDVAEAILPLIIQRNIELFYVKDDSELDQVGNIAALLRFRSDQSGNLQSITEGRSNSFLRRRKAFVARAGSVDRRMIS